MSRSALLLVYLFYGLSFFSMGLIVALEGGRGADARLRHALRPLAAFGLIHGLHEWIEVFAILGVLPLQEIADLAWQALRIAMLAFSFLSLSAFGASLLSKTERARRLSMLVPVGQASIWGFGVLVLRSRFLLEVDLLDVVDAWSRYTLGIPAALIACVGLIAQQREFRRVGMARFGRDSLWAAIAFAWYGLVGQIFTRMTPLPPSTFLNQDLFLVVFGFPVQVMRALAAGAAAAFVIRFLRSFEVENQRQIAELQAARLHEAEARESLRGELLRRVVSAQEAERQRIARELHDETGQALTAIGLGLRGAAGNLRKDPNQAAHNLRQLEGLVSISLTELQRLIADLRPSHLDDLGLAAALRWYFGEVKSRTELSLEFDVSGQERDLEMPIMIALFRIVQESINNIIKHAEATTSLVFLNYRDDAVTLNIQDNGRGFQTREIFREGATSWGLMGIRERATLLGGRFRIDSTPGVGTVVEVSIPYQRTLGDFPMEEVEYENPIVVGR